MKLLKELAEAFGPPGFEDEVRTMVLKKLKGLADEVTIDRLGSVIAIKRATKSNKKVKRVMLAGHLDEIGFVVTFVDKDGFLRLNPLGGFDPKTLIAKRVVVLGNDGKKYIGVIGTKPIHIMDAKEREAAVKLKDLFVDLGMSHKQVSAIIEVGAPVALSQDFLQFGDLVSCKSLDNRIAVWTLLRTLEALKDRELGVDVYAVFTTQEEVGLRGAIASAYGVEPDLGVAIDVTLACDMPDAREQEQITKLRAGPAIKICDSSSISNPAIVKTMRQIADKKKIPYQLEILPFGGTDAGGIQRSRAGVPVVTMSLPTRYVHTVVEAAAEKDLLAGVRLLTEFLCVAHQTDFGYSA